MTCLKKNTHKKKHNIIVVLNFVNWKLRFFKINGKQLEYFDNANETIQKGIFVLQPDMEILHMLGDEKRFSIGNKSRKIYLQVN